MILSDIECGSLFLSIDQPWLDGTDTPQDRTTSSVEQMGRMSNIPAIPGSANDASLLYQQE